MVSLIGGEGEIRTLAPIARPTPLAGAPLQPLEYYSVRITIITYKAVFCQQEILI